MPTQLLLNGLSGTLQDSESWNRQQALAMIRDTVAQTLASLTPTQQREYVKLQREAHRALMAVEAANNTLISTFKAQGLARLRAKVGGQDPEKIYLHTRYLEPVSPPLPWEPRASTVNGLNPKRFRRAYDEWKYRPHLSTMSLWEAACLNFSFATQTRQASGHTFVDASYLSGSHDKSLTVEAFIAITRELDLGGALQATLNAQLRPDGNLHALLRTSARACLRFEALEAYRNRRSSGLTLGLYNTLIEAIDKDETVQHIEQLALSKPSGVFPQVTLTPPASAVPLPLLLIPVASLGVVSYFPFRPGGALRFHPDARSAHAQFLAQLKESHRKHDLGWFSRQLPITELNEFKRLLYAQERPEGLSAAAAFLYDSLHYLFPEHTLADLRFTPVPKSPRPVSVVDTLTASMVQQLQSNLATLANTRTDRDVQAVIDGAAAIAAEVLELLLTPVPGGVTGLNQVMQVAVFGSLAHSVTQGVNEALKGEASTFAAAIGDVADLAISGLLTSTAGRVHRRRMNQLLQQLGNPRKVTRNDGSPALWKPDISPYAILDQHLLNGQIANAQGIYSLRGKQYVWLQAAEQKHVVEVGYDNRLMRFVLKNDHQGGFAPPIVFAPHLDAWTLDLQNAHTLSNVQLAERMLPNGAAAVPIESMENLLRSTATSRSTLDAIWAGQPTPVNLTEGVRRLQADRVIEQLIHTFHRRGHMPPHADGAVLCLLTQLPEWPAGAAINVYDGQGNLSETYSASEQTTTAINIKRRDDGRYAGLDDPADSETTRQALFELILRQQPAGSVLGKAGSPLLNNTQRIARLRLQISALAQARRADLFNAMTRFAGYARHEMPADHPARSLVPTRVAQPLVAITPLLRKLHERYPPLTPANLAQLLKQHPLTSEQQARFLQDATLPPTVHQGLEQHRIALRLDAAIDGLYHSRPFNPDNDQWAREFASSLLRTRLNRAFVVTEVVDGVITRPYVSTGPDDTTVELRHYGEGRYEAYDMRNGGTIPVSPTTDSFYLAIASVLQPHERTQLGMTADTDAKGLRKTLGDLMSERRGPEGVSLLNGSLGQYEQNVLLPAHVQANAEGIYQWRDQQLIALYGSLYPITFDQQVLKWRLKHPQKVGVDTPRLEHNGHGAWRLASEDPLSWDDHALLYRLGPQELHIDRPTSARILAITDTPARALREVHSAGLPPPPLLADTRKRVAIERQILHFIEAMRTASARHNARPTLQLMLLSLLPGWPETHVLQVVGRQRQVLAQYPARVKNPIEKILISEADARGPTPLHDAALNDTLVQALLGELPGTVQERQFKLAKKIAEYAYQERAQLFEQFYTQSEQPGTLLETRLKAQHPHLPVSAVRAILGQATLKEQRQLQDKDQVGLRLAEQARLTANDLRLNRAYEGLYLTTLMNPDSDSIILHLLKTLPGWPAQLRLDVHSERDPGRLLESGGNLNGTDRRSLIREGGRYRALDAQGRSLNDPADSTCDLLSAIILLLSTRECEALGVADRLDLTALQARIVDLALNQRVSIKRLLDLPHIPPWLQPPMQVNSSFVVYPLSLQNLWPARPLRSPDLISKVQALYPSLNAMHAGDLIDSLGLSQPALLLELERRRVEYASLDYGLTRWAETPQPIDDSATDPLGLNMGRRRHLAQHIRRAWRRETWRGHIHGQFDTHCMILRLDDNNLPDADFILGTRGFEHIEYLNISGNAFPPTGNAFLSRFSNLRTLNIDCLLNELPVEITQMRQLQILNLGGNNITLTEEARQRLGQMTALQELNLNDNPLRLAPDVSAMERLRILNLRNTQLDQWPAGAESRPLLTQLLLQENQLTTLPPTLFQSDRRVRSSRNINLHDNPLNAESLALIGEYRLRTGNTAGGPLPGIVHQLLPADCSDWLSGIPQAEHAQRRTLWDQLLQIEEPRPDDAFRVFRDLTSAYAYRNTHLRPALTKRVWKLMEAMGDSTELRNEIFLNTYLAGTCGDGALLTFIDMEIAHRRHQAKVQPATLQASRELMELSISVFFLRELDQFAEEHILALRAADKNPDDVEIKLYLRIALAQEFSLPVGREEMLYSVDSWVSAADVTRARQRLQALKNTDAAYEALMTEPFWIEFMTRHLPEPFTAIRDTTRHKIERLNREELDRRSDAYLDRRQAIIDDEKEELASLLRQLTQAIRASITRP
ncbi:NEL-type E3 ubiquitin ligase domain-containing protein [Pseudomonas sp. Env-37]|uniref:NEL-type E3 ubiquitin ligase domain-containing protein n=1 Tax=Pseudomonas sp. Env-37 TaxID=3242478 RepID=UPI0035212C6F